MPHLRLTTLSLLSLSTLTQAQPPSLPAITAAMEPHLANKEIAGVVTLVASPNQILHLAAQGHANIQRNDPMRPDHLFWIASMTKPITAVAILMLQEQGKLSIEDPVSKYLPEFSTLKNADGTPPTPTITLKHLLTHTAGLPENTPEESRTAQSLQDLISSFSTRPLQFTPGTKWQYSQTAINSLGRIIEVVSHQSYPDFLQSRLFTPLNMPDTTFYPSPAQLKRLATSYRRDDDGTLHPTDIRPFINRDLADTHRVPLANGGLFSTPHDYTRFAQMLLNNGTLDNHQYLKPESVKLLSQPHTGTLETGFTPGNAWGLGVCVVLHPQGVSKPLSPTSYGHGGAYGTQAWIDPTKHRAYLLFVQRANFPNSDNSPPRKSFQSAAAQSLDTP